MVCTQNNPIDKHSLPHHTKLMRLKACEHFGLFSAALNDYIAKHSWSVLQLLPVHIHTFPWLCKLSQLLNQCVSAVFHKRNHLKQTNKQQLSTWNFQLEKSKVADSLLSFWQQRKSGRAFVFASSMPPPWLGTVLVLNYPSDPRDLEIAAK